MRNKYKRIIAGVSSVALLVTTLPHLDFKDGINDNFILTADASGDSFSVEGGSGDGNGGTSGNWEYILNGITSGVRIYYAPKGLFQGVTNGNLRTSKLYSTARSYSLYEFAGYGDGGNAGLAINNGAGFYEFDGNDGNPYYNKVSDGRLLSMGKGENTDTIGRALSELAGSSTNFTPWMTRSETGSWYTVDFTSLSAWTNAIFSTDALSEKTDGQTNLDRFIKGYAKKMEAIYGSVPACIPKNISDFQQLGYCVVVEPVMVAKANGCYVTVSYQDFFKDFGTGDNLFGQSKTATNVIYNMNKNMGKFYAVIKTKFYGDLNIKEEGSSAGFGVFCADDSWIDNAERIRANHNVVFYADDYSEILATPIANIGGSGCNSGSGNMAIVHKNNTIGEEVTDFASILSTTANNSLGNTDWYNKDKMADAEKGLRYVTYGKSASDKEFHVNFRKSLDSLNNDNITDDYPTPPSKIVDDSPDSENFKRLVGSSYGDFNNRLVDESKNSEYILVQAASYDFSKSGIFNAVNMYSDYDISNIETVVRSGVNASIRDVLDGCLSLGNSYTFNLQYKNDNTTTVSGLNRVLLGSRKSANFVDASAIRNSQFELKGTENEEAIRNVIGNTITESLSYSDIKVSESDDLRTILGSEVTLSDSNTDNQTTAKMESSLGVSAQFFVKDKKFTSGLTYIKRDAEGNISYEEPVIKTSSIFNLGEPTFSVPLPSADAKSATYIVALPNATGTFAKNYDLTQTTDDNPVAKNFADLLFATEGTGFKLGSLNTPNGLSDLKGVISDICSYSQVVVKPLGRMQNLKGVDIDHLDISVGAVSSGKDFVGYSIYVIEDALAVKNQEVSMHLESKNLNYVYPTLLGDTEGHLVRTISGYDDFSVTKSTAGSSKYEGALIQNDINMTDHISIFYNQLSDYKDDKFDLEATNPKSFSSLNNGVITLNHAVNFTRKAFNDTFTASAFNPSNNGVSTDYIENILGLTVGNTVTSVDSDIPAGTVGLKSSGKDKFIWVLDKGYTLTDSYIVGDPSIWQVPTFDDLSEDKKDDFTKTITYTVSPIQTGEDYTNVGYNVTDKVYRYKTNNRDVGSITGGVNSTASTWAELGGDGVRLVSAESFDTVFNFTPEVAMEAYIMSEADYKTGKTNSGKYLNTATKTNLYVLGEKVRQVKASGVYITSVENSDTGDNFRGKSKSDTVAAGTEADALSKKLGGLQVVYAGGNINLSAQSDCTINVSGFMLDQIDETDGSSEDKKLHGDTANIAYTSIVSNGADLKAEWGNEDYNALANYEAYVDDLRSKLAVDVGLNTYDGSDLKKQYKGFKSSVGKLSGGDVDSMTAYALTFKGGTVDTSTEAYKKLIEQVAIAYYGVSSPTAEQLSDAAEVFKQSGIYQSILSSIESRTDADNHSGGKCECCGINKETWYDEVVRTFVVRYFNCSPIKLDNIAVSDKVDIKAGPSQNDKDKTELFKKGYTAKWNITVYLKEALDSTPDMVIYKPKNGNLDEARKSGSVLIAEQHIVGADFIISDATTADMRN